MSPINRKVKIINERIGRIGDAVNASINTTQKFNFTFLLFFFYIGVLTASTSDYDLLTGTSSRIPLLNIELSVIGIYSVMPILVLLCHLSLFIYFYHTAQKVHKYCLILINLNPKDRQKFLFLLNFYPPAQMLFRYYYKEYSNFNFILLFVFFNVILPPTLLLFIQIKFLPYHHQIITMWVHRVALFFDLVVIGVFLPKIFSTSGCWLDWFHYKIKSIPLKPYQKCFKFFLIFVLLFPVVLSFCVFTIPDERIEKILGIKWATEFICNSNSLFHRNLQLSNKILVKEPPPTGIRSNNENYLNEYEVIWKNYAKGLSLQNRDLRFANFSNAILINADLSEANLQGAWLGGTKLINANMEKATIDEAYLVSADLRGANLYRASAVGARFSEGGPRGFHGADLRGADLSAARLSFSKMMSSKLEGANLYWAHLVCTDLSYSNLRAANFRYAKLYRTNLYRTDLRGADFRDSALMGVSFFNADLRGTSAYGARISNVDFENSKLTLVDFRKVKIKQNAEEIHAFVIDELESLKMIIDKERLLELKRYYSKRIKNDLPTTTKIPKITDYTNALYDVEMNKFGWPIQNINLKDFECALISYLIEISKDDIYVTSGLSIRCDPSGTNRVVWPNLAKKLLTLKTYKETYVYPCTHSYLDLKQLLNSTQQYAVQYSDSDCN